MSGLHGILLVDKEQGWTSHDVVAKARGITHQRKIGHTGTLDPMATGLLVLCLGDATRLVEYMTGHDKRYEGTICLGATTDTDDAEGSVISRAPVPVLTHDTLRQLERQFTGPLRQRPPAYSAVKVAGQRAYAAARAGNPLELAERTVTIHRLYLEQLGPDQLRAMVDCASGTYIRSLARDIGAALGCGAHLMALRRLGAGRFDVSDAVSLAVLESAYTAGWLEDILIPPDEGIADTNAAILNRAHTEAFRQGRTIQLETEHGVTSRPIRVYDTTGGFVGVGSAAAATEISPAKVFTWR